VKSYLDDLAVSSCCRALKTCDEIVIDFTNHPRTSFSNIPSQQLIAIMPAEALEMARKQAEFSYFCRNCDAHHPDGERSQIFQTNSIDRLCTQPYHNTVKKIGFACPRWLGDLNVPNVDWFTSRA